MDERNLKQVHHSLPRKPDTAQEGLLQPIVSPLETLDLFRGGIWIVQVCEIRGYAVLEVIDEGTLLFEEGGGFEGGFKVFMKS